MPMRTRPPLCPCMRSASADTTEKNVVRTLGLQKIRPGPPDQQVECMPSFVTSIDMAQTLCSFMFGSARSVSGGKISNACEYWYAQGAADFCRRSLSMLQPQWHEVPNVTMNDLVKTVRPTGSSCHSTGRPKATKTLMRARMAGPRSLLNRGTDTRIEKELNHEYDDDQGRYADL